MGDVASTRERFEFGTYHLPEATRRGDDKLRFANDDETVVVYIDNAGAALTAAVKVTIEPARLDEQATWRSAYNATVENTRRAEAKLRECRRDHDEFVNEVLALAPEAWDQDAAAEHIAVEFVRHLVDEVERLGGQLYPWEVDVCPKCGTEGAQCCI